MPSYFIGELSETRLFDLVKPLLDGKKSGMISIKGREYGEIHIEAGQIIHAWTNYNTGEEAILAIMEWRVGRVSFDWEVTTEDRTVNESIDQLLLSWANRGEDWNKIREYVPSPGVMFRIAMHGGAEDRNIPGDQWKVLALCNGSKSVSDIAASLQWDIFKTSKAISQMVQSGLLERSGEALEEQKPLQKRTVNGDFFPFIENELKKIMGPIAPIIIDDIVAETGESRESFPQEMVDRLLGSIVDEIPDMGKRAEFSKAVHNALINENKAKL